MRERLLGVQREDLLREEGGRVALEVFISLIEATWTAHFLHAWMAGKGGRRNTRLSRDAALGWLCARRPHISLNEP